MAVVFLNDFKMPVVTGATSVGYATMNQQTHLKILGDWVRFPRIATVFSIGDLVIFAGFLWVFIYYAWYKLHQKTV